MNNTVNTNTNGKNAMRFLVYSLIGIFMFFIPIKLNGSSTIPIDHIVSFIKRTSPKGVAIYALIVIVIGGVYPFINKSWNKNKVSIFFSFVKLLGIVAAIMGFFNIGPKALMEKDMIPFLYSNLAVSVGIIVPIGSVFLAFLVGYGLMEFIGVFMQPIMRPIWKTPGRSAIDAVASFVGSYSIALLITNRVYREGKYTTKEAAIIATGFSTVSATFMIVIAKTLNIMDRWNTYFWVTLVVTFIVTAITARLRPLRTKSNKYYNDMAGESDVKINGNIFVAAWKEGMKGAEQGVSLWTNIVNNLRDGFKMAINIVPSILSLGLIGLIFAKFTPVFDVVGYIFYPFTLILGIPEPMLAAKAVSLEIAEMFLPALLVVSAPLITKFVVAVVSVSAILFFSASIPCILSTDIPISIPEILVIWVERTILTIILTVPFALLLL